MLQGLPEPGAALSPVELCYELQMVEAADEGLLDQDPPPRLAHALA